MSTIIKSALLTTLLTTAVLAGPPAVPAGVPTTQTGGASCTASYGDQPATIIANDPSALLVPDAATSYLQQQDDICVGVPNLSTAQIIPYTDSNGTPRSACLISVNSASASTPLPLLVWLHPSLFAADGSFADTGMQAQSTTTSLNGDNPAAVGFHILLPNGRDTYHHYPAPDDVGLGWDNWYRNYQRGTSGLNVDVETIDYFIATTKTLTHVDNRRVHLGGWSNGAAMALQYAIQTPGIASAAVYSAPDPERDANDPCAQIPNPKYNVPTLDVHNQCDIIGICTTGLYYYQDLQYRYPSLTQEIVIIDDATQQITGSNADASCDPTCAPGQPNSEAEGSAAHLRWPILQNQLFFNWYLAHPLPASGSWPTLSNGQPKNYPAA